MAVSVTAAITVLLAGAFVTRGPRAEPRAGDVGCKEEPSASAGAAAAAAGLRGGAGAGSVMGARPELAARTAAGFDETAPEDPNAESGSGARGGAGADSWRGVETKTGHRTGITAREIVETAETASSIIAPALGTEESEAGSGIGIGSKTGTGTDTEAAGGAGSGPFNAVGTDAKTWPTLDGDGIDGPRVVRGACGEAVDNSVELSLEAEEARKTAFAPSAST